MPAVNREYADLFEKYGYLWADSFNKVQGRGWNLLPTHPRNMEERNRVFADFVKKGYAVHTEERYGDYYIYTYMMKLPETGGRVSERYVSESHANAKWQDLVDSLRISYVFNFKLVIEDVRRKFPSVPEKDIVDYIIKKYIGKARLRKAVYKRENRLVNVWSMSYTPTNFLVEGVGIRNYADLSFDPVKISTLEKTGMYPPEHVFHITEIKEIIRGYRIGYTDAATAIEDINEVVERM